MERKRFARPKKDKVVVSFRLGENEYNDLRRCAVSANLTMTDWLKWQIEEFKQAAIKRGEWDESINR